MAKTVYFGILTTKNEIIIKHFNNEDEIISSWIDKGVKWVTRPIEGTSPDDAQKNVKEVIDNYLLNKKGDL